MIYLINESGEQISLKATETSEGVVTLSVLVNDSQLDVASTEDVDVAAAIMERFKEAEIIKNPSARFNFKLNNARTFIDRFEREDMANMPKIISIPIDGELPERYTVAKDMIAIVHNGDDVLEMAENDLNGEAITISDEQNEFNVTLFVIKWYNWSRLKGAVNINKNGKAAYALGAIESTKTPGRTINSVKSLTKKNK